MSWFIKNSPSRCFNTLGLLISQRVVLVLVIEISYYSSCNGGPTNI